MDAFHVSTTRSLFSQEGNRPEGTVIMNTENQNTPWRTRRRGAPRRAAALRRRACLAYAERYPPFSGQAPRKSSRRNIKTSRRTPFSRTGTTKRIRKTGSVFCCSWLPAARSVPLQRFVRMTGRPWAGERRRLCRFPDWALPCAAGRTGAACAFRTG